jgi:predicted ATPase/class 3 adenylate cyclase
MLFGVGGLPAGDVTFAFVDVVGSTRLLQQHGESFVAVLKRFQHEVAVTTRAAEGAVVSKAGDGAFLAFESAAAAMSALKDIQHRRSRDESGLGAEVRAGLHRGHAIPVRGDYVALPVHIAARVMDAAGGRQVLATSAVIEAVGGPQPGWHDFGERRLRDVVMPIRLWHVDGPLTPPRAEPVQRSNVALPQNSFLGRDELVAQVLAAMDRPGLVTIVGAGGLGKTRLASEVGVRLAELLAGGSWMIELAGVSRPDDVLAAVTATLDLPREPAVESVLAEAIAHRPPLAVILDNCEHVIDAAADAVGLLMRHGPQLRILCTSREPLELPGEVVIRPQSLLASRADDGSTAAADLFIQRAAAVDHDVPAADRGVVEDLVAALDGLPLAIELAASRAYDTPLPALLAIAQAPAESIESMRRRGGEPRQRTLDAIIRWSDERLSDSERNALRALSVFPSSFSPDAAGHVLSHLAVRGVEVTRDATALARRSLLDVDGDRLRMLHTIRSFAAKWLAEQPALHVVATEGLISWAAEWSRQRQDSSYDEVRGELQTETPNLIAALTSITDLSAAALAGLMRALFSGSPAPIPELVQVARDVQTAVRDGLTVPLATRVAALDVLSGLGVVTDAAQTIGEMHALVTEADATTDPELMIRTRLTIIRAVPLPAEEPLARRLLSEALELAGDQPSYRSMRAGLLTMHGIVEHLAGNFSAAIDRYEIAVAECLAVGNHINVGTNLLNQAEALLDLGGDFDRALATAQRAMQFSEERSPHAHIGELLTAEAYAGLGLTADAAEMLERKRDDLRDLLPLDPSLDFYIDRATRALASLAANPSPVH